jgi:hypothetical protein
MDLSNNQNEHTRQLSAYLLKPLKDLSGDLRDENNPLKGRQGKPKVAER